jgi:hypothetical protein
MRSVPHKAHLPVLSTTLVSSHTRWEREIDDHLGEHGDELQGSASDGMQQLFSQTESNN